MLSERATEGSCYASSTGPLPTPSQLQFHLRLILFRHIYDRCSGRREKKELG